jgi:hypothetical protein
MRVHETLKRHSAFLTDGSGRNRRLRIHLFDTGRSPSQLIAHTCTAVDTCTVEERPMEIPHPTIHVTPERTMQPSDPALFGWLEANIRDREFSHVYLSATKQPQHETPVQPRAERPMYITSPSEIHVNVSVRERSRREPTGYS